MAIFRRSGGGVCRGVKYIRFGALCGQVRADVVTGASDCGDCFGGGVFLSRQTAETCAGLIVAEKIRVDAFERVNFLRDDTDIKLNH